MTRSFAVAIAVTVSPSLHGRALTMAGLEILPLHPQDLCEDYTALCCRTLLFSGILGDGSGVVERYRKPAQFDSEARWA